MFYSRFNSLTIRCDHINLWVVVSNVRTVSGFPIHTWTTKIGHARFPILCQSHIARILIYMRGNYGYNVSHKPVAVPLAQHPAKPRCVQKYYYVCPLSFYHISRPLSRRVCELIYIYVLLRNTPLRENGKWFYFLGEHNVYYVYILYNITMYKKPYYIHFILYCVHCRFNARVCTLHVHIIFEVSLHVLPC